MATLAECALSWARDGFSVIPCYPMSKRPRVQWEEYQKRPASEREITRWWIEEPNSNIAIVTGRVSGVTVVDVDGENGLHALDERNIVLPTPTYMVKSPAGLHFYYHYQPEPHTVARLLPNIDIRNDGGVIVVPPSVTEKGQYTVLDSSELATLGDTLPLHPVRSFSPRQTVEGWVTGLINNGTSEGNRNSDATRLTGYLWSRLGQEDIVHAFISLWNQTKVSPPLDQHEIDTIVGSVCRYHGQPFSIGA